MQVGGLSQVVEQARGARTRELGQQHERNKMFCTLIQHARTAVARFTDEKTTGPLDDGDASYLNFFTGLMGKLEEGAKDANELVEEECHDLLTTATTRLFSNLLLCDRVMVVVPPELYDRLAKEVQDHMADFIQIFTHVDDDPEEDTDAADDDGDDNAPSP